MYNRNPEVWTHSLSTPSYTPRSVLNFSSPISALKAPYFVACWKIITQKGVFYNNRRAFDFFKICSNIKLIHESYINIFDNLFNAIELAGYVGRQCQPFNFLQQYHEQKSSYSKIVRMERFHELSNWRMFIDRFGLLYLRRKYVRVQVFDIYLKY